MIDESRDHTLVADFVASLNRHGYAFQHAVVQRGAALFKAGRTGWVFEATEFPVRTQDAVTHIDLVFRAGNTDVYLVGECKRVDPALGTWGFARAPFTRRNARRDQLVFEELAADPSAKMSAAPFKFPWSRPPYQIGTEIRTKATGDGSGGGRDSIERSVTQVLRGVNGLADRFYALPWDQLSGRHFRFVPAIFTTAEVWTTEADLREAELSSGRLPLEGFVAEQSGWIWFNYNLSPHLKHTVPLTKAPNTLSDSLIAESTRSVAIVSPAGIDDFLTIDLASDL